APERAGGRAVRRRRRPARGARAVRGHSSGRRDGSGGVIAMAPSFRPYDEATELDWDRFVAGWWERRVVVFRAPCAMPFPLAAVFAWPAEAGRRQLGAAYDVAARRATQFSIEEQQEAFVEPWLPVTGDGDFAGYAARLAAALGGRRHALVSSRLHGNSFAVW